MRRLPALLVAFALALVVGVPTAAPLSVQPVTIACSVGSPFTLAADPDTLTQLTFTLAAMSDPTCALTQTNPTAAPADTYAVGGGLNDSGTKFSFSAHLNTPDPPSGYAHIRGATFLGPADVQGHVICLTVSGNTAHVGFEFEKGSSPSFPTFNFGSFDVEDNGPPGSGLPDRFTFTGAGVSAAFICNLQTSPFNNVVHGNIVVR
jgi:hypothetical protein